MITKKTCARVTGNVCGTLLLLLTLQHSAYGQTCPDSLETMSDERLVDQDDGTVYDTETGILWYRCSWGEEWSSGQCQETPVTVGWSDALILAEELSFAGYTDWRIPNINELQSIIEWGCYEPAVNTTAFPDVATGRYWSSTARQDGDIGKVLMVDFYNGRMRDQSLDNGYVLFVRQMQ